MLIITSIKIELDPRPPIKVRENGLTSTLVRLPNWR